MTAITSGDGTVVRIAEAIPDRTLPVAAADLEARVAQVGSTGATAVEPLVAVTRDGETSFHTRCSGDELDDLFAALAETGDPSAVDPDAVVEHDPETTGFPAVDRPGLAVGVREVTSACGWRRPANPTDHEAAGGFPDSDPDAVLDLGTEIRGRGWGDWCRDEYPAETCGLRARRIPRRLSS
jgi:NADH-quinone oxidoreductase subunit F